MKLNIYFFVFILGASATTHPFSYDSAVYAAQKGDIKSADEQMRTIVVNSPDEADVLYDAGVLASQLNNASQAAAYFARSAECAHDDKDLSVHAHFNAGNALVDNKELKMALQHYDDALAIDPDNEYVRHNRDRVAQMLQEQESSSAKASADKQEKNKDQQDQKDDKDEQQDDQQNKDGQNNEQDQSGNENDQQSSSAKASADKQQKNNGSDKKSDKQSQGEQGEDPKNGNDSEQGKQQGNADKHQQNSAKDKKGNRDQGLDEQSQGAGDKGEQEQGKQHEKTPNKNKEQSENSIASQGNQEQGSMQDAVEETGGQADKCAEKIKDPWLLGVLNDQELRDKEVNKKLMEAKIRQHGGKNGQNCW
jgi:Ca-activated chloride channel homolog